MVDGKLSVILDANDILFSTQYIYMKNISNTIERTAPPEEDIDIFDTIKASIMYKELSFFQSIQFRNIEHIVSEDQFFDIMKYSELKESLSEGIQLSTPYSKYMMNLHKIAVESNVIIVYANELEKFLLETKIKDFVSSAYSLKSKEDICKDLDAASNLDGYGLYTSDSTLIEKYLGKIDILIPNDLRYLKQYHEHKRVFPLRGLWAHVK